MFAGAGHIPHATKPDAYVEAIITFTRKYPF
jgi:pimeloyl-ACP methyl ester carboxylesterase